ncbi:MAG: hypothetical protein FD188_2945 [Ignavibacteria bacterium]|nr:MAG: hypothetical protein FD188_2945 [Ignavibacteria bacterium]
MLLLRIKQYPKYFLWLAVGLVIITLLFLTFFYNKRQSVIIKKIASSELALSDSLGMPYGILYHQNKILILDKKPIGSNNQVAIYDTKTGKLISAFGRSGPGPGEFLSVKSIAENVVNPKLITIFDSGLLRFSVFDCRRPDYSPAKR